MKKCLFLLILLVYLNPNLMKAQNVSMGFNINIGYNFLETRPDFVLDYEPYISNSLGFSLEKKFKEQSSFICEAQIIQMGSRFTRNNIDLINEDGVVVGQFDALLKIHAIYVGIPLYYKHSFGKTSLRLGIQTMIPIQNFTKSNHQELVDNVIVDAIEWNNEASDSSLKIGPKLGFDYLINDKFDLRIDFYHGFIDLRNDDAFIDENIRFNDRQLMLGIHYKL